MVGYLAAYPGAMAACSRQAADAKLFGDSVKGKVSSFEVLLQTRLITYEGNPAWHVLPTVADHICSKQI